MGFNSNNVKLSEELKVEVSDVLFKQVLRARRENILRAKRFAVHAKYHACKSELQVAVVLVIDGDVDLEWFDIALWRKTNYPNEHSKCHLG